MRVFIAMLSHETNTFSALATDRAQFEKRELRYGGEVLEGYRGTATCLGGMIDGAGARGLTLLPSLAAAASPAGRVSTTFYEEAKARTCAGDIHDAGLSIYVATHDDAALAAKLADRLEAVAWEHRREFRHRAVPVREAVAQALRLDGRPIVLADIADNAGGGAAGDGTEILRELLRVDAPGATVACVWDPEAAQACTRAGRGATVTVAVGGKVDDRHGAPVTVTGRVIALSDGSFVHQGPRLRGLPGGSAPRPSCSPAG